MKDEGPFDKWVRRDARQRVSWKPGSVVGELQYGFDPFSPFAQGEASVESESPKSRCQGAWARHRDAERVMVMLDRALDDCFDGLGAPCSLETVQTLQESLEVARAEWALALMDILVGCRRPDGSFEMQD